YPAIDRCRLIEFALGLQHVAEVLPRFEKSRLQVCRLGEMTGGPLQVAKPAKCFADVVMKIRDLVVEQDCLADQLDGTLLGAGWDRDESEQVEAVKMIRDPCQDLPVKMLGLRKLAALVKRDGFGKSLLDFVRRSQVESSWSLYSLYT